jgi:ubiquinone/menaquinone biosynthesis C-methylase UbiE
LGGGTDSALRYAASKNKNGNLIGMDPIPRMIEIAQELTIENKMA